MSELLDNLKDVEKNIIASADKSCRSREDVTLIAVSKTKRKQNSFNSRYVKIVYEDRWLIVVEKNIGILSMAAGH